MGMAGDAFGVSIWDYYKGRPAQEVIERDDGLIDPSEVAPKLYFAPFEEWPVIEKEGVAYARGRVLDVGCGAGRVSLYLQGRGCDVLAIDRSPLAVRVSRLRGVRRARVLALQDVDFRPGSLDSVVMFGNNFGLLGSQAGAMRLLRRFGRIVSPGGVIVAESVDPYATDNPDHLEYQKRNRARGRMSGQVRIRARCRTVVGPWFDYLLVSQKEMEELAQETGWRVKRFITSRGSPPYVGVLERA